MSLIRIILPLFIALSICMTGRANAADDSQERCATMRLDQSAANAIGYSLKRMKFDDIDIGDSIVVAEPRMAGLRGPNISLLGRDVRLAVTKWQTSPQELWHKGSWNRVRVTQPCQQPDVSWKTSIKRGMYGSLIIDHTMGLTNYEPRILYRTRMIGELLNVRPYGFTLGAALSAPLDTNTSILSYLPDARDPVRRDIFRFATKIATERLYASWHNTPINNLHVGVTGGYLEEMYVGAGAEVIYRPFPSAFWLGADGWGVWRRDPDSFMNMNVTDESHFTGHVRAGYDIPNTSTSLYAAAGKYLAGDVGGTVGLDHDLPYNMRFNASITWTDRSELQGFFKDMHFDPVLRLTMPLGAVKPRYNKYVRTTLRQVGRDGGQQLDRPMPLEYMTAPFSARDVGNAWPKMFESEKKEAIYIDGL